ncbi:MAG: hypothetical protein K5912_03095 [Alphaproteobacteria bacterium]|nr:hypothetical protein [Alphaproteobacteria bacterium]
MKLLEIVAKVLTFFGAGCACIASLWLWIVPMVFGFGLSSNFVINLWAGVLMIATFFGLMITGLVVWTSLENKKK